VIDTYSAYVNDLDRLPVRVGKHTRYPQGSERVTLEEGLRAYRPIAGSGDWKVEGSLWQVGGAADRPVTFEPYLADFLSVGILRRLDMFGQWPLGPGTLNILAERGLPRRKTVVYKGLNGEPETVWWMAPTADLTYRAYDKARESGLTSPLVRFEQQERLRGEAPSCDLEGSWARLRSVVETVSVTGPGSVAGLESVLALGVETAHRQGTFCDLSDYRWRQVRQIRKTWKGEGSALTLPSWSDLGGRPVPNQDMEDRRLTWLATESGIRANERRLAGG
jgi:hypothetical protein